MKRFFTAGIMLSMITASITATNVIGYSNGNVGRATIFRTATDHTGLAIRIPAEKLRPLAGHRINALQLAVGSKKSKDGNIKVFISTEQGGAPVVEETHAIESANKWETYTLSTPYMITGSEEELYIGYTLEIPKTYQALSADMSLPIKDVTYALFDNDWRDISDMNVGQGNIRAVLDSDPYTTDLLFKPLKLDGYYKQGGTYSFSGDIFNFGTTAVNNFKISLQIGSAEPQIYDIDETIEPSASYTFNIPDYLALESGKLDVRLKIEEIDGSTDNDPSDNMEGTAVFFYPQDMERALLLEGFTGQDCSNCPTGHRAIESAVEKWGEIDGAPEVIEVSHHSGYFPDYFTMAEDMEYTSLYAGGLYAPAFMVNRMAFGTQVAPVVVPGESVITEALEYASATMPYVALNLETAFDPSTRKLDIKVQANTFNEIPQEIRTLNVMLCQDNIVSYQAGMGSEYVHNHVFRGALTGNAWGVCETLEPGTTDTYETSYVIPDEIHSSYYEGKTSPEYDITAVPEDMYVVAYVAVFDEKNINKRYILNCAKAKLGESKKQGGFSGIDTVRQNVRIPGVSIIGGKVRVDKDCRAIEVYNLAGMRVDNENLRDGIYIVRVMTADGNMVTAKAMAK